MTEQLAREHYEQRQLASGFATFQATRMWAELDPTDLDAGWRSVAAPMTAAVSAAQAQTAAAANTYLDLTLGTRGMDPTGPRVRPEAFAGVASDGRPLETLLYQPVIQTKAFTAEGMTPRSAMGSGLATLQKVVRTQVVDAGRTADGAGLTGRKAVAGYVRHITPPACSRCAILAGAFYRWNKGFLRHPNCACVHRPTSEAEAAGATVDPHAYFDSLDEAQQNRIFTKAGASAIRDGSDIGQVVNARRGMSTASVFGQQVKVTSEGATVRASFGRQAAREGQVARTPGERYRRATGVRLMPEQIYIEAAGNRDEAIRLLRRFGYLS